MGSSAAVSLKHAYYLAKARITEAGFSSEVHWQEECARTPVTESRFLRESAWVVLCAGMREAVVSKCFPFISEAFGNWKSAAAIARDREGCVARALEVFHHTSKVRAIVTIAERLTDEGLDKLMNGVAEEGPEALCSLPWIGPATSRHLAKNLGLNVAKPDRHLVRIAEATGYPSAEILCRAIAAEVGDTVAVVDVVLWRFASIDRGYLDHFRRCSPSPAAREAHREIHA